MKPYIIKFWIGNKLQQYYKLEFPGLLAAHAWATANCPAGQTYTVS